MKKDEQYLLVIEIYLDFFELWSSDIEEETIRLKNLEDIVLY